LSLMILTLESLSLWLVSWFWHLSLMILTLESSCLRLVSWFWHLSLMILTLESSSLWLVSWFWHLSLACQLPVLTWDLTWNLHLMAQDLLQTWHQWLTTYLLETWPLAFASQTHTLKCWYFWPPHHVIGGHYVYKCLLRRDVWAPLRINAVHMFVRLLPYVVIS